MFDRRRHHLPRPDPRSEARDDYQRGQRRRVGSLKDKDLEGTAGGPITNLRKELRTEKKSWNSVPENPQ